MTDSQKLLSEYAVSGSDDAFRELVARYIDFVYSTARRLVGTETHLAEDVTQIVFIHLAQKGRTLSSGVLLGGWLHQHTYYVATKAVRGERRRQSREREALEMNTLQNDSESDLRKAEPILDEAITALEAGDRTAILLRFFERRDFRSVGAALGSNENAARMRVNRALEKLQVLLKHRGVTLSVTALTTLLATEAVTAAPARLALAASRMALTSAAAATDATFTLLKLMTTANLKMGLAALSIGAVAITALFYQSPRTENKPAPQPFRAPQPAAKSTRTSRLPAPPMPVVVAQAAETSEPNALPAAVANRTAKLSAGEVESYLAANRRSASSLLAAFRTTDDPLLLQEAMQKYPGNPQVAFEAVIRADTSPAERRQWLDALKQAAPDNALPNYLSALDYFKAGRADLAVQDLTIASGTQQFQDYSLERASDDEEAYRAAGRSAGDAKLAATTNLRLPHLAKIRDLGRTLVDLAGSYQQSGDDASGQAALQMALNLGRRYGDGAAGESLISQLVGISVERSALTAMDPESPAGVNQQTVRERIEQLGQERTAIRELNKQAEPLWESMSDQDWASYLGRSQVFGEYRALAWLVGKYGQK